MTRKDIAKLFIRFLITFALSLAILIPLGFLLEGKVGDFVMILVFVVLAGAIFAVEEYIRYKLYTRRQKLKEKALREEELKTEVKKDKKQKNLTQKNKKGVKNSGK